VLKEFDRRHFLKMIAQTATATAMMGLSNCGTGRTRPNIILIMSDDMGFSDIGCYGSEVDTPHLDRLAAHGLRYLQFYNTARCCPTRASLLTGLYPHQAGVGHMMNDRGTEAYQGDLSKHSVTIAQVLRTAGYATYMSGKWHVTPKDLDSKHNWPLQRGFDRFFGTIHGAGSFYDPNTLTEGNEYIVPGEDFYYTDAISDHAVKYIDEHNEDNPFFMYVAYTAAHWPLHARQRDIEKYRGKYDEGWSKLRQERYQRMIDMGLIDSDWPLSAPDAKADKWDFDDHPDWHARCMEVYAAMIDSMDQGIGRIVQKLEQKDELDNTLIFFLQDNGACAEMIGMWNPRHTAEELKERKPMAPGELQKHMVPEYTRDGRPVRQGTGVMPGPADTYIAYSGGWANASNTPFRMYKHWIHEGGIATPLIVHWPAGIEAKNVLRNQPGHLIDIMATCVDVANAAYPTQHNGETIHPMQGKSLVPTFADQPLAREALYWEHEGNRAIRIGKWKLVSKADDHPHTWIKTDELPLDMWELYDLEADRTEMTNLAATYPDRVKAMAEKWQAWARQTGVVPKPY
jgi:arylsulfatase